MLTRLRRGERTEPLVCEGCGGGISAEVRYETEGHLRIRTIVNGREVGPALLFHDMSCVRKRLSV